VCRLGSGVTVGIIEVLVTTICPLPWSCEKRPTIHSAGTAKGRRGITPKNRAQS
jgi:hypothetical protein